MKFIWLKLILRFLPTVYAALTNVHARLLFFHALLQVVHAFLSAVHVILSVGHASKKVLSFYLYKTEKSINKNVILFTEYFFINILIFYKMKRKQIFIICLLLTFFTGSVCAKDNVVKLRVENMTCGGCSGKINKTVSAIDGVSSFEANLDARVVTIAYDDQKASPAKLKEAIQAIKYNAQDYDPNEVITRTVSFKANQIGCGGCVAKVKKNIGAEAGVLSVEGDATTKEVKVQYDANKVTAAEIKQDFQKFKYTVTRYWTSEKVNYASFKLEELNNAEEVAKTLAAAKGIYDYSVNPETKTIAVAYDNTVFADNALLSENLKKQNLKLIAATN